MVMSMAVTVVVTRWPCFLIPDRLFPTGSVAAPDAPRSGVLLVMGMMGRTADRGDAPVTARPSLLYVTDLSYPARGRRYCDEDIWLTARLRADFEIALCHPLDAAVLMDRFDAVVVRNSGP